MSYKLILPPNIETVTTGFAIAGEKQIGKNVYRVEIWTTKPMPLFLKNNAEVTDPLTLPKTVIKMANSVIGLYNTARQNIG